MVTSDAPRNPPPTDDTLYTLTVEQTAQRFAAAGFPRSPRTIQRYCQLGHLKAASVATETGRIYLIDEKSVDQRIEELRHVATFAPQQSMAERHEPERNDAPERDMSRQDASRRDATRHDATDLAQAKGRIAELENENRLLEIDKRVRDGLLTKLDEDRSKILTMVADQGRQIGKLEERLALLDAPKGDNSRERETPPAL